MAAEFEVDIGGAVAAEELPSGQLLRLYVPDRDRAGTEIGTQRRWVLEAARLLAGMGGGATVEPPVEGPWFDPASGTEVWERPVLVYSYIDPDRFVARLPDLRSFLHRLGRETEQGEVVFGELYRMARFDS